MPKGVSVVPTTTVDGSFLGAPAIAGAGPLVGDGSSEARELAVLSTTAVETLNFALWSSVEERAGRLECGCAAFSELQFPLHWGRSVLYEANGRPAEALESARAVCRSAASEAANLLGRCRRASVLLRYGERLAHRDLALSIRRQFGSLDLSSIRDWTTAMLPVEVAETLAFMGDPEGAANALRSVQAITNLPSPPDSEIPVRLAMHAYATGLVADAAGGSLQAQRSYRRAFEAYRRIGFTRRAMSVGLRLAEMTGDEEFAAFVDSHARALSPQSWIRARLAAATAQRRDPVLQRLSRAELEILAYLVAGRSTADIAAARSRSPQTTRNTISKLLSIFGVASRSALLREVGRRRLLDADGMPTWEVCPQTA
jgi:DNA-binding CsgD family transcriptional regulator